MASKRGPALKELVLDEVTEGYLQRMLGKQDIPAPVLQLLGRVKSYGDRISTPYRADVLALVCALAQGEEDDPVDESKAGVDEDGDDDGLPLPDTKAWLGIPEGTGVSVRWNARKHDAVFVGVHSKGKLRVKFSKDNVTRVLLANRVTMVGLND